MGEVETRRRRDRAGTESHRSPGLAQKVWGGGEGVAAGADAWVIDTLVVPSLTPGSGELRASVRESARALSSLPHDSFVVFRAFPC